MIILVAFLSCGRHLFYYEVVAGQEGGDCRRFSNWSVWHSSNSEACVRWSSWMAQLLLSRRVGLL